MKRLFLVTLLSIVITGCNSNAEKKDLTSIIRYLDKNPPSGEVEYIKDVGMYKDLAAEDKVNLPEVVFDDNPEVKNATVVQTSSKNKKTRKYTHSYFNEDQSKEIKFFIHLSEAEIDKRDAEKVTLEDGTTAYFFKSEPTSDLFITKKGYTYIITGKTSDFSKDDFVDIANSLK